MWLALGSLTFELRSIVSSGALAVIAARPHYFIAAAVMGFAVNSLAYIVIQTASSLTLKVLATVKNVLVVCLGVFLLGEKITLLQGFGYSISLLAFYWYQRIKMQQIAGDTPVAGSDTKDSLLPLTRQSNGVRYEAVPSSKDDAWVFVWQSISVRVVTLLGFLAWNSTPAENGVMMNIYEYNLPHQIKWNKRSARWNGIWFCVFHMLTWDKHTALLNCWSSYVAWNMASSALNQFIQLFANTNTTRHTRRFKKWFDASLRQALDSIRKLELRLDRCRCIAPRASLPQRSCTQDVAICKNFESSWGRGVWHWRWLSVCIRRAHSPSRATSSCRLLHHRRHMAAQKAKKTETYPPKSIVAKSTCSTTVEGAAFSSDGVDAASPLLGRRVFPLQQGLVSLLQMWIGAWLAVMEPYMGRERIHRELWRRSPFSQDLTTKRTFLPCLGIHRPPSSCSKTSRWISSIKTG
jgi:hypothetical protein